MRRAQALRLALSIVCGLTLSSALWAEDSWNRGAASYVETLVARPADAASDDFWPVRARLLGPTDSYDHDILGGIPPWTVLEVEKAPCPACNGRAGTVRVRLSGDMVFEDLAPRLWDVTGDGKPEIVVVETHLYRGARLAVWALGSGEGELQRLAATRFIGRRHRWLAPVLAADMDGDGEIEIAYVDRPHLAKELVILSLNSEGLRELARLPGLTAHRIGERSISAASRPCADGGTELLLPDADWRRLLAVRLGSAGPVVTDIGPFEGQALSHARQQACLR